MSTHSRLSRDLRHRRGVRALLLVVLSCGALLVVGAVPAAAKIAHKSEFSFNGSDVTDTPTGPFSSLGANAVDQTGAAVYVLDWGRSVVDKFNADGTYAGVQITGASTPATSLGVSYASGIAVDNSGGANAGDLYVADTSHGVVDKFTASGTFMCQVTGQGSASTDPTHECSTSQAGVGSISPTGLAVDASGNLWVADSAHDVVDEFDSAGNYTGQQVTDSHITSPATIALDSSGNLYVTNIFSNVVEFASTGAFVRTLDSSSHPISVGVDPATAHVYVGDDGEIAEYDSTGNLLDTFGNSSVSFVLGLAVRGSSGEIYADAYGNGVADVFGPDVIIPDVTATAATEVAQFTATLNGTVDPAGGGNVESCQFEYGTSTSYGQTAPCSPATPYAGATNVSASLSALSPDTTYHFRVAASNSNGIVSYSSDETLTTPALAVSGQATKVTATSATLGGTVDPDGATITECHFEYGPTVGYGESQYTESQPCASTPSGSSAVAVSADIAGLVENTSYHFRVVAAYSDGSNSGSSEGSNETFTTLSRPLIDAVYTSNLTESSVDLNAEIDPKGLDTTYRFEWGTSTSYGNSVPVPDADIGSGSSDVLVSQHLSGLSANTIYHWRVVATNSVGTTEGKDHTFVYQTATPSAVGCSNEQLRVENALSLSLPDCRAYEQVSPVDTNDSDVVNPFGGSVSLQASVDGERIFYSANGAFPGAPNAKPAGEQYLASRGASGWSTLALGFPLLASHSPDQGLLGYSQPLSPDLSTGVLKVEQALVAGAPGPNIWNLYVGHPLTGSYELVTDVNPPGDPGGNFEARFEGASTDFSHVIFYANDALTPEAPPVSSPLSESNLYEWAEGQLHLVGLIPTSGTSCTGAECTPAAGRAEPGGPNIYGPNPEHAISADGSRIVFTSGGIIYDRLNGTTTVEISASQRTSSAGSGAGGQYQDASVDGSHVLFTSSGALTNDAVPGSGYNLYDYDVETGQLTDLTPAADAGVGALAGTSEDASHVYFVAEGVLAANSNSHGDRAVAGQPNLYLWNGGQTTFIATTYIAESRSEQPTRVTPDGAYFAFESTANLTGYDNEPAEPADCRDNYNIELSVNNPSIPCNETFLYDAKTSGLVCASCDPSGARPIGPSELHWIGQAQYRPRNLSADGSRLFFTSSDALLPGATDGLFNVYEWEVDGSGSCETSTENGGCVYLISSGSGVSSSYFADASTSGNDLFFQTGDSLVGQDEASFAALYDARVGGGLASQDKLVVAPACTSLEGCLSPLSEPPAQLSVASAELHGSGNLVTPPEVPITAVKKTAAQIRAEKLTKALKACKKEPKRKRAKCQRQANKSFGKAK
jgi:hypothetical protein